MDDEDVGALVVAARDGDVGAWNELVSRYERMLWWIARGYRLDDAEAADVCQTTWLKLVEHLEDIREPEKAPGWLATTVRRECLKLLRRSGRSVPTDTAAFDLPDEDADPVESGLLETERDVALWQALRQIDERCQLLLRMLAAGAPYVTIAETLGLAIGSVGATRGRCLDRLRTRLEAAGITSPN